MSTREMRVRYEFTFVEGSRRVRVVGVIVSSDGVHYACDTMASLSDERDRRLTIRSTKEDSNSIK